MKGTCRICKQEYQDLEKHWEKTKCGYYGTIDALISVGEGPLKISKEDLEKGKAKND